MRGVLPVVVFSAADKITDARATIKRPERRARGGRSGVRARRAGFSAVTIR
jgi:hypothetical protein